MIIVETFAVGMFQCNCSILSSDDTREALVIDPGDEFERILAYLRNHELICRMILQTHAHIDHIGATAPLAKATGAEVLLHGDDRPLYEHAAEQAALFGLTAPPTARIDRYLKDGDTVRAGEIVGEVLHTPGHSPGSISLWVPWSDEGSGTGEAARLFAGDTLFAGSIGRTDLWGGSTEAILRSIRERLFTLPDDTIVIPGHGESTTIGLEKRENPFLNAGMEV